MVEVFDLDKTFLETNVEIIKDVDIKEGTTDADILGKGTTWNCQKRNVRR